MSDIASRLFNAKPDDEGRWIVEGDERVWVVIYIQAPKYCEILCVMERVTKKRVQAISFGSPHSDWVYLGERTSGSVLVQSNELEKFGPQKVISRTRSGKITVMNAWFEEPDDRGLSKVTLVSWGAAMRVTKITDRKWRFECNDKEYDYDFTDFIFTLEFREIDAEEAKKCIAATPWSPVPG